MGQQPFALDRAFCPAKETLLGRSCTAARRYYAAEADRRSQRLRQFAIILEIYFILVGVLRMAMLTTVPIIPTNKSAGVILCR